MANARTDEVGTTLKKRSWVRGRSSKLVQHLLRQYSVECKTKFRVHELCLHL